MINKFLHISIFILLVLLPGCAKMPEDQRAYDACTDSYNEKFRFLPGSKAIVSGVRSGSSHCYWVWSRVNSTSAILAAMKNCQTEYQRCFLYASDFGVNNWAKQISDNGGVSQTAERVRRQNDAAASAFMTTLSGLTGMMASGRSQNYYNSGSSYTSPKGYTGGGTGDCDPTATIAHDPVTCEVLH